MNDLENTSKSLMFERAPPKLLMVVVISAVMVMLSAYFMIVSRYSYEVNLIFGLNGSKAECLFIAVAGDASKFSKGAEAGRGDGVTVRDAVVVGWTLDLVVESAANDIRPLLSVEVAAGFVES
jgi:hypothetical protein